MIRGTQEPVGSHRQKNLQVSWSHLTSLTLDCSGIPSTKARAEGRRTPHELPGVVALAGHLVLSSEEQPDSVQGPEPMESRWVLGLDFIEQRVSCKQKFEKH